MAKFVMLTTTHNDRVVINTDQIIMIRERLVNPCESEPVFSRTIQLPNEIVYVRDSLSEILQKLGIDEEEIYKGPITTSFSHCVELPKTFLKTHTVERIQQEIDSVLSGGA